jgi:hypothetical protein
VFGRACGEKRCAFSCSRVPVVHGQRQHARGRTPHNTSRHVCSSAFRFLKFGAQRATPQCTALPLALVLVFSRLLWPVGFRTGKRRVSCMAGLGPAAHVARASSCPVLSRATHHVSSRCPAASPGPHLSLGAGYAHATLHAHPPLRPATCGPRASRLPRLYRFFYLAYFL